MNKIKAIKYEKDICFKCLNHFNVKEIKKIEFGPLGYGGYFDECSTMLQLCETCFKKAPASVSNPEYDPEADDFHDVYLNEDEIVKYFDSLSAEGQQFVKNEFWRGGNYQLEPQDWLDYNINKCLPYEAAKEYGLYALEEIEAYGTRFPKCEYPAVKVWKDGSRGCWCPYGAHGNDDQSTDLNISEKCYSCHNFKERESELKVVESKDWSRYVDKALSAAKASRPMVLEIILFTSYGVGCLPEVVKPAINKNPEGMLFRDRVGAVVEELKKAAVEIESSRDYNEEIVSRIKETGEVVYLKDRDEYRYYVNQDSLKNVSKSIRIVKVDTTKYWTFEDYDGVEDIRYIDFEIVDELTGYCKFSERD